MAATEEPRAWRLVLDRIEADLFQGELKPGDRLPGERILADSLGVGRSSVREALRVLEVMGVIRTSRGSGPASGAMIVATPADGLAALLRLQTAAQAFPFDDIVSTRLVLESAVAADLATAGGDLSVAEELLAAMEEPLAPSDFLILDARFHQALAESSGNRVVATVMAGLRGAIEGYVQSGAHTIADWDATVGRLRAEHAAVLDAIRAGDPTGAIDLIRSHISGYYAQMRRGR